MYKRITTTRFRDVSREEIERIHPAPRQWEQLRGTPVRILAIPFTMADMSSGNNVDCEGPLFEMVGKYTDSGTRACACLHWIEVD